MKSQTIIFNDECRTIVQSIKTLYFKTLTQIKEERYLDHQCKSKQARGATTIVGEEIKNAKIIKRK